MNLSPTCQPAWESRRTAVWCAGYSNRHFTILPSEGRINNAIWSTDGNQEETKGEKDLGSVIEEKSIFTLSHCLSLSRRMMTSLGNIWWPFSLNDRFLPSKVTFMTYLETQRQAGVGTSLNYTQCTHAFVFNQFQGQYRKRKSYSPVRINHFIYHKK